jgi:hypothetical protein
MNSVGSLPKIPSEAPVAMTVLPTPGKIKVAEVRQEYRQKFKLHRDGVDCATMDTVGKVYDLNCL